MNAKNSIILFDGVCNLCNFFINFLIDRDPHKQFRFASLQSDIAKEILLKHNLSEDELDSVVLIQRQGVYIKSDAVLQILNSLSFPWHLTRIFMILPRGIRDRIYDWVAKNRLRWFGKRDTCRMPESDTKERFLG